MRREAITQKLTKVPDFGKQKVEFEIVPPSAQLKNMVTTHKIKKCGYFSGLLRADEPLKSFMRDAQILFTFVCFVFPVFLYVKKEERLILQCTV